MAESTSAQSTSLIKALRVLAALEDASDGKGVSEIARELDLPKSAVHRLLVTFQAYGFVQQESRSRNYRLGPTLARLGLRAAEQYVPREVARPYLEALAREMGETVFLGVLAQHGVLIVDKVEHGHVLRVAPDLGTLLPLCQTALGKLLLAFCSPAEQEALLEACPTGPHSPGLPARLRAIARQGYAVAVGEWMPDLGCVAAPIRNGQQHVIAALAVSVPQSRMPPPQRHDPFAGGGAALPYPTLIPPVMSAAERISAALP
ncbi:IclR family transcriptional regulator [Candidatus Entotheonella palauensis]|uniref:IclR family transcriptional regulator n=1 Tax=Candidatus Entotheonella palauensis TaxID=93172 RepID=UPI000B7EA47F|nr:IclR family transcriptional regulator [Candidatus Entotheonella palauensis]